MTTDFSEVTEVPGLPADDEQVRMMVTRYRLAADLGAGREILEVACGAGIGLGLMARRARRVVGGDVSMSLLREAARYAAGRLPLLGLDARALPFRTAAFDVVLMFEAIYYLPDAGAFAAEARRVLRPGGILLIVSANREWPGFIPSPYSVRYFSAAELKDLLERHRFRVELRAGFPEAAGRAMRRAVRWVRRAAARAGLIPTTLAGRARLKRWMGGRQAPLGGDLDDGIPSAPTEPVADGPVTGHRVLYAVARRGS